MVIKTDSLTKTYGETSAVVGLDLEVEAGEVFGFIGPNGAGKTTTIRMLLDLIRPSSGTATVFGLDVRTDAMAIHARTGYLPGDLQLYERLTANELFAWLGRVRRRHDDAYAIELSERLGLDRTRKIGDLSTGNRRKVGVVQAFMHRPELLVLDEPTSGLDPVVQREFRTLVSEARDVGTTVFLSSHVLAEVEQVCDRVGTIVGGRLRRIDTVAALHEVAQRQMRVVFADRVDASRFEQVEGVIDVRETPAAVGHAFEIDSSGSIDDLVKELANHRVLDMSCEPRSLEDVFLEAYDTETNGEHAGSRNGEVSHVG